MNRLSSKPLPLPGRLGRTLMARPTLLLLVNEEVPRRTCRDDTELDGAREAAAVFRNGLSRHRAAHAQVSVDLDEALAARVSLLR